MPLIAFVVLEGVLRVSVQVLFSDVLLDLMRVLAVKWISFG